MEKLGHIITYWLTNFIYCWKLKATKYNDAVSSDKLYMKILGYLDFENKIANKAKVLFQTWGKFSGLEK